MKKPIILITEDDDGHVELIKEYLAETGIYNDTKRFANGYQLIEYLCDISLEKYNSIYDQYIILLDLRMPVMDGFETLKKIRHNKKLEKIPVIIFSTTDNPEEVRECYKIGCNLYINKPISNSKFLESFKIISEFIKNQARRSSE